MLVRKPVQADQFYAGSEAQCHEQLEEFIGGAAHETPGRLLGGIVPHAGWVYSGRVAGEVFATLATAAKPTTVVIFGAVHHHRGQQAALFPSGCWETPIGPVQVDERLGERVLSHTNLMAADPYAHEQEHSIEVQVPFVRRLLPEAMILPIMVPPTEHAAAVGDSVARTIDSYRLNALVVGSTDLTHYGPSYGFCPEGADSDGVRWAKEVNDRRVIDLILQLDAAAVVPESRTHRNACGAGAVAATIAAVQRLGADRAVCLHHITSHEVLSGRGGPDSVGYAGIVFVASEAGA